MSNSLFRKSSIDRINSPEQLNEYVRVARPGVWLVLAAVILLLVGVIIWGLAGTVTTVVDVAVFADGEASPLCLVRLEDAADIEPGMSMRIAEQYEATVVSVTEESYEATQEDSYILQFAGINVGDHYCSIEIDAPGLEAGIYKGEIEVERIRPITFVTQ